MSAPARISNDALIERRTLWPGFRATHDELIAIAERAGHAGMKPTAFIRMSALGAEVVTVTTALDHAMRQELARIGNLLAQIDRGLAEAEASPRQHSAPLPFSHLRFELGALLPDVRVILKAAYRLQERQPQSGRLRFTGPCGRPSMKCFRASPDEVARIGRQAARAGLTLSDFIRRAALGETIVALVTAHNPQVREELQGIGKQLNRVAMHLNATGASRRLDDLPFLLSALRPLLATLSADVDALQSAAA